MIKKDVKFGFYALENSIGGKMVTLMGVRRNIGVSSSLDVL